MTAMATEDTYFTTLRMTPDAKKRWKASAALADTTLNGYLLKRLDELDDQAIRAFQSKRVTGEGSGRKRTVVKMSRELDEKLQAAVDRGVAEAKMGVIDALILLD